MRGLMRGLSAGGVSPAVDLKQGKRARVKRETEAVRWQSKGLCEECEDDSLRERHSMSVCEVFAWQIGSGIAACASKDQGKQREGGARDL